MLCYIIFHYISEFSDTSVLLFIPREWGELRRESANISFPPVLRTWHYHGCWAFRDLRSPPCPACPARLCHLGSAACCHCPVPSPLLAFTHTPTGIHRPLSPGWCNFPVAEDSLILTWIKFPFPQVKPGIHILKILTERLTYWKTLFSVSGMQPWMNQNLCVHGGLVLVRETDNKQIEVWLSDRFLVHPHFLRGCNVATKIISI